MNLFRKIFNRKKRYFVYIDAVRTSKNHGYLVVKSGGCYSASAAAYYVKALQVAIEDLMSDNNLDESSIKRLRVLVDEKPFHQELWAER